MKGLRLSTFVWCLAFAAPGQGIGTTVSHIVKSYEENASRFKAGDTNVPLLKVDWFYGVNQWPGVQEEMSCFEEWRVTKSGVVSAGFLCISQSGGKRGNLSEANLQLLIALMNRLPPPPTNSIPTAQKLLVGGIRSNKWFHAIYNRTNLPPQVRKLSEITGAKFEIHSEASEKPPPPPPRSTN